MGRIENYGRRDSSIVGLLPARDAKAPPITILEARKVKVWGRGGEVVAALLGKGEKLLGHPEYAFADEALVSVSELRFMSYEAIARTLEDVGLSIQKLLGDWDGSSFDPKRSREILCGGQSLTDLSSELSLGYPSRVALLGGMRHRGRCSYRFDELLELLLLPLELEPPEHGAHSLKFSGQ